MWDENTATLRVKGILTHPNPNMWDFVAYRIRFVPHPHIGEGWCIYPTYDFTHCIIDSLEWITASCCTLEFEVRSHFTIIFPRPKFWIHLKLPQIIAPPPFEKTRNFFWGEIQNIQKFEILKICFSFSVFHGLSYTCSETLSISPSQGSKEI